MIRSICMVGAASAALFSSAGAAAQNAVLYGLIDASAAHVRPVGGEGQDRLDNGYLQRSFIGLRGSEDLGGGLRAVFKLESYLRVDTGSAGRVDGDPFWGREASVGLSGSFGTTVLGRVATPLWLSTITFNPFGESIGFSPAVRQYFGGAVLGDTRWNNAISYTNNARDPLRIQFAANVDETTPTGSNGHNLGAALSYITGPFAMSVAAERIRNSSQPLPAGFDRQVVFQAGASYDFTFIRVYGQIGRIKTEATSDARTDLYQLGASIPLGTGFVLIGYGRAHTTTPLLGTTDQTTSIGYDYFLSKNTDIYVAGLYQKLSFVSSGHTIASGVRLRF
jgi:predicted porin